MECPSLPDRCSRLLAELSEKWERSNQAMIAFDGATFARLAAEEAALCDELARFPALADCLLPAPGIAHLAIALQQHRALLGSTQRTVRALWGVCAVSGPTYEVAPARTY